jgi:ribosome recycling factor
VIDLIYEDAQHRMDQAVVHARIELSKVRTGRANPELLDFVKVEYYGTPTPLKQLATISIPEARLIAIQPYEKNLIPDIERAIMESNLGLTPSNNGTQILVPIPPLSEERRRELIRYVHQLIEDGRVAVRNVRRDANHQLKSAQQEEHISEDEIRRAEQRIQELTNDHIERLNQLQEEKEKEILEV